MRGATRVFAATASDGATPQEVKPPKVLRAEGTHRSLGKALPCGELPTPPGLSPGLPTDTGLTPGLNPVLPVPAAEGAASSLGAP